MNVPSAAVEPLTSTRTVLRMREHGSSNTVALLVLMVPVPTMNVIAGHVPVTPVTLPLISYYVTCHDALQAAFRLRAWRSGGQVAASRYGAQGLAHARAERNEGRRERETAGPDLFNSEHTGCNRHVRFELIFVSANRDHEQTFEETLAPAVRGVKDEMHAPRATDRKPVRS